jgi:hypothetical protein
VQKQIAKILQYKQRIMKLLRGSAGFRSKLATVQKLVHTLQRALQLPQAYDAYLTEIVRRRNFQENYQKKATQARDYFSLALAEENSRLQL